MSHLVVNAATEQALTDLQHSGAHAVLLVGRAGSGKAALAQQLAESCLQLSAGDFTAYQYGLVLQPLEGKAIGIEQIRQLEHFLRLKVPVAKDPNRAVIIENAQTLTIEAQNALLKTLEEPPAGSLLILTATSAQALLPTIRSRVQLIRVQAPSEQALLAHFRSQQPNDSALRQALVLSGGSPGLMHALLTKDDHPLRVATEQARTLLSAPLFERLLLVDALSKQRQVAIDTLGILEQMAVISLQTARGATAAKWRRVLSASFEAREALNQNAQPKLVLTNLMISLS